MKYDTTPRKQVISFLSGHPDLSFSMEDICSSLPLVGKSTVYRIVDSLEEEGRVRRTGNSGRKALYQYSSILCCGHMHIKCHICGRTEHLDGQLTEKIREMVDAYSGFYASPSTVIDGLCSECRKNKEKE